MENKNVNRAVPICNPLDGKHNLSEKRPYTALEPADSMQTAKRSCHDNTQYYSDATYHVSPVSNSYHNDEPKILEVDSMDIDDEGHQAEPNANLAGQVIYHPPVDTCFGAISVSGVSMDIESSKSRGSKSRNIPSVELQIVAGLVKILQSTSGSIIGLLPSPVSSALIPIARMYGAEFSAIAYDPSNLSISILGPRVHARSVGAHLSSRGVFLQPRAEDDSALPYINPQLLLPPGAELDQISKSTISSDVSKGSPAPRVDCMAKSRINQVLDDASGPSDFTEVHVTDRLHTELKPHQKKALSMMMEKESGNVTNPEFSSVWRLETTPQTGKPRYKNTVTGRSRADPPKLSLGGLLADDMGLGKTLSALALIASTRPLLSSEPGNARQVTLVVTPLTTLTGWEDQIQRHFKPNAIDFVVYYGSKRSELGPRLHSCDVVLTTYETVRGDFNRSRGPNATANGPLYEPHWHRVILDEAHIIRTRTTESFKAITALKARHRWCLTGTPIHNSIEDLGSLVAFLKVTPFDDAQTFKSVLTTPVLKDEQKGWKRLASLVQAISLRRVKSAEQGNLQLPSKQVDIVPVTLNTNERAICDIFLRGLKLKIDIAGSKPTLFQSILRLRQVCNHGSDLLPLEIQEWLSQALRSADIPHTDILMLQTCEFCDRTIDGRHENNSKKSLKPLSCSHFICDLCLTKPNDKDRSNNQECPICCGTSPPRDIQNNTSRNVPYHGPSSKVTALLANLEAARAESHDQHSKSLVFSSWTKMLDLIEPALLQHSMGFERLDGTKTLPRRRAALKRFREDPKCTVLLASIGSAAVGLDLTAASHVHLVEPSWNPMLEQQALDRVHRLGQTKSVRAFRYLVDSDGSIEMHIDRVQKRKLNLMANSFRDPSFDDQDLKADITDFLDGVS